MQQNRHQRQTVAADKWHHCDATKNQQSRR